jgi:hypothetical protein
VTARAAATARVEPRPATRPTPGPGLRPVASTRTQPPEPRASLLTRARRRLSPAGIAAAIVVACLLAVVVGNMQLAAGQLRLEQVQTQLASQQSETDQQLLGDTLKLSPQAVAQVAGHNHLGPASEILQIPSVSLERRLPPPTFSYAPCCSLTPGR